MSSLPLLRVRLPRVEDAHGFIEAYHRFVGRRAIFIGKKADVPLGTEVNFAIDLANQDTVFEGRGRVARVETDHLHHVRGLLIHFEDLPPASLEMLDRLLARKAQGANLPPGHGAPPAGRTPLDPGGLPADAPSGGSDTSGEVARQAGSQAEPAGPTPQGGPLHHDHGAAGPATPEGFDVDASAVEGFPEDFFEEGVADAIDDLFSSAFAGQAFASERGDEPTPVRGEPVVRSSGGELGEGPPALPSTLEPSLRATVSTGSEPSLRLTAPQAAVAGAPTHRGRRYAAMASGEYETVITAEHLAAALARQHTMITAQHSAAVGETGAAERTAAVDQRGAAEDTQPTAWVDPPEVAAAGDDAHATQPTGPSTEHSSSGEASAWAAEGMSNAHTTSEGRDLGEGPLFDGAVTDPQVTAPNFAVVNSSVLMGDTEAEGDERTQVKPTIDPSTGEALIDPEFTDAPTLVDRPASTESDGFDEDEEAPQGLLQRLFGWGRSRPS